MKYFYSDCLLCRHFCSRDAADIEGVSGKKLEYLFTQGFVHSVLDLYTLRERDEASGGGGSKGMPSCCLIRSD
jgi:NAD-dependent DNA ligase